jgi:hypothetical protein
VTPSRFGDQIGETSSEAAGKQWQENDQKLANAQLVAI